jgi:hypothetical protein
MADEKLGRFGHHPDPLIDFETEVGDIEAEIINFNAGIGYFTADQLEDRIDKAMEFQVGGVPAAVSAKQKLRELNPYSNPRHSEHQPLGIKVPGNDQVLKAIIIDETTVPFEKLIFDPDRGTIEVIEAHNDIPAGTKVMLRGSLAADPSVFVWGSPDPEPEDRPQQEPAAARAPSVADILRSAADLFEERNEVYADNYKNVGPMMAAMFPEGLQVQSAHDWNRLHILLLKIVKLTRYAQNWETGGHEDSTRDDIVYGGMLAHIDASKE